MGKGVWGECSERGDVPMTDSEVGRAIEQAGGLLEPVKDLALKIFGPATEEFGLAFGEQVRQYRLACQVQMLSRTKALLEQAGVRPAPVHLKILLPLLDGAWLEDDENLAEMWANLLATAADPDSAKRASPRLPPVLRQLSPIDAAFLDYLQGRSDPRDEGSAIRTPISVSLATLDALKISAEELDFSTSSIQGLGLINVHNRAARNPLVGSLGSGWRMSLTPFAFAFLRACQYRPGS